jgi:hypothetical protein
LLAKRALTALVLSSALLLGSTGCTFMGSVESLKPYQATDGAQLDLGNIKLRDIIYFSNGKKAELFGSIVNSGLDAESVSIQYIDANGNYSLPLVETVGAGQKIDLGFNGGKALSFGIYPPAGTMLTFYVAASSPNGQITNQLNVPVSPSLPLYSSILDSLNAPATKN